MIPLFSGGNRRGQKVAQSNSQQEEKVTYSYNVYVLSMVEFVDIYEDMLEKSSDVEILEQDKFLKLIKESHSLLQCKYYELLSRG